MGNPLIAFTNWVDVSVVSGGAWRSSLPLNNLRDRQLARLARSLSTDPLSTYVVVDLLTSPRLGRVMGFLNHNISLKGTYRVRLSNDPTFATATYDSGYLPVWGGAVYPMDQVLWESTNFWTRTYTPDDIDGYPHHLIHVLPASKRARYWRLDINDPSNPDGYIQAGRLFVGDGWSPSNGIPFGCSMAWEDPSTSGAAISGAKYYDGKKPYRVAKITTHFMPTNEAFSKAFEIQRRSGTWKEVLYIHDLDDTLQAIRRRFPGVLRALGPVENPYPDAHQAAWEIEEALP